MPAYQDRTENHSQSQPRSHHASTEPLTRTRRDTAKDAWFADLVRRSYLTETTQAAATNRDRRTP